MIVTATSVSKTWKKKYDNLSDKTNWIAYTNLNRNSPVTVKSWNAVFTA